MRLGLCTYEVDGTYVGDSTLGCTLSLVVLLVDKSIYRNYDRMIGNLLRQARYATSDSEELCLSTAPTRSAISKVVQ